MNQEWPDTVPGVDAMGADASLSDEARKKLAGDPASDSGSGVLDDITSELVDGVLDAAGNVVSGLADAAGDLLSGLFD